MDGGVQPEVGFWVAIIIQMVGIVCYFIAKNALKSKAPFLVTYLNIILTLFLPVNILLVISVRRFAFSILAFYLIYPIIIVAIFIILKIKQRSKKL